MSVLEAHPGGNLPPYEDSYPREGKGSFHAYENVSFSGGRKLSRKYSSRKGRRLSSVCSDCGSIVVVDESGNSHPIAPKSPLSTVFVPPARPKCPTSKVETLSARFNIDNAQEASWSKPETKLKPVHVKDNYKMESKLKRSQKEGAQENTTASSVAALRARLQGAKDQDKTEEQIHPGYKDNNEPNKVSNLRDKFNKTDHSASHISETQSMSHLKGKRPPKLPGKT